MDEPVSLIQAHRGSHTITVIHVTCVVSGCVHYMYLYSTPYYTICTSLPVTRLPHSAYTVSFYPDAIPATLTTSELLSLLPPVTMAYRDGDSSDDSTLYSRGSRHRRRRSSPSERTRRPRRSRRYASPPPRADPKGSSGGGSSSTGTFIKLGLGVVLVQIVATCFSSWVKDKQEATEKEYRDEKRRAFEKAKAKRRRDEEEHEKRRQREEDDDTRASDWDEREVIIREGRRLAYAPGDADSARELSGDREVRRIEPAPDDYYDDYEDDDYEYSDEDDDDWDDVRRRRRRRAASVASRSQSRFGRRKSVTGMRGSRSRSRPAERVT